MSEYSFEGHPSQESGKESVGANLELRPVSTRGKNDRSAQVHDCLASQRVRYSVKMTELLHENHMCK